jgi:hypothetical protein
MLTVPSLRRDTGKKATGRGSWCKVCKVKQAKEWAKLRDSGLLLLPEQKVLATGLHWCACTLHIRLRASLACTQCCSKCRRLKPSSDFSKDGRKKDGELTSSPPHSLCARCALSHRRHDCFPPQAIIPDARAARPRTPRSARSARSPPR